MADNPHFGTVDHLFRHEAGRLTAVLVRVLGSRDFQVAEDIVQDTLLTALETWRLGEMPANPAAWLTQVAKNKAIDHLRHQSAKRRLDPMLAHESQDSIEGSVAAFFSREFTNDEVRLMFSCCAPGIAENARVAIILNTLSGFSAREISAAFLESTDAVARRLTRAKATIRKRGLFDVNQTDEALKCLPTVHRAIYLMFNEGYHSSQTESPIRAELCFEALRMGGLLVEQTMLATPSTHALMAMMCFHAARLDSRTNGDGELLMLKDQDRSNWSAGLTAAGFAHLRRSAQGNEASALHLQAALAATHAAAKSLEDTDWELIVSLYNQLLDFEDTAVVRLNRAIAVGRAFGPERGLQEFNGADFTRLAEYPFYHAARSELLRQAGRFVESKHAMTLALQHARNASERRLLQEKQG